MNIRDRFFRTWHHLMIDADQHLWFALAALVTIIIALAFGNRLGLL